MDVRREGEATPTKNRTEVERKSERELVVTTHRQRACAPCVRGVDQGRPIQEVVGTKIVWGDPAFLRNGCSRWGAVSFGVSARRFDDGVLRHVPRSDTALAPRLDQRGR